MASPMMGEGKLLREHDLDVILCKMSSFGDVRPSAFRRKAVAVVEMIRRLL